MRSIAVEGWRGIFHSIAVVNQFQLMEMVRHTDLTVHHIDVPYVVDRWKAGVAEPGFSVEQQELLSQVRGTPPGRCDLAFRIAYPWRPPETPADRHVTFLITEFGFEPSDFSPTAPAPERFCAGDDLVVTPSRWSRDKLIEAGFPEERVHIVPHGISDLAFTPLDPPEIDNVRISLGLASDEFAFLNLGALTRNKGFHLLIRAFSILRAERPQLRLILKDAASLYGITVEAAIKHYVQLHGALAQEVLESILIVPSALSLSDMRRLYGGADCYVAPYLAEGFNLPVLESIACGTPVIATAGGSTDDFCSDATTLGVESTRVPNSTLGLNIPGVHLQPDLESLLAQMRKAVDFPRKLSPEFRSGVAAVHRDWSWRNAVDRLLSVAGLP